VHQKRRFDNLNQVVVLLGSREVKNPTLTIVSLATVLVLLLSPLPAQAQSNESTNSTSYPVPGCAQYIDYFYMDSIGLDYPHYRVFCGSDEMGWYNPTDWCSFTGYCFSDYGLQDE
jgi:hypothetical protein